MKKVFLFFILLVNLLYPKTVVLATDPFPPFLIEGNKGVLYEIAEEAFKVRNYEMQIVVLPWKRALELTAKGEYDGLIGVYKSPERELIFDYSSLIMNNEISYYTLAANNLSVSNLKKYRLGIVRGYSYSESFDKSSYLKIEEAYSGEDNLRALLNKRVDVILESDAVVKALINMYFVEHDKDIVKLKPYCPSPLYIAVSKKLKNSSKIIEDFNEGLKVIKNNGTYNKILKKYGF